MMRRQQVRSASQLILVSKSPWTPSIRREHALARQAIETGTPTAFVEQPQDLRSLAGAQSTQFVRGFGAPRPYPTQEGVIVSPRSTLLPGHRGGVALTVETALLARHLGQLDRRDDSVVVAMNPWSWPAVAKSGARRKVVDLADDWAALLPDRQALMQALYRQIAHEADAVIVASPDLATHFPDRTVDVVRNATDDAIVATAITPPPHAKRLMCVGTFSDRVDFNFLAAALDGLPDWSLDLYGECRFPGSGTQPSRLMKQTIQESQGRICWRGVVARSCLRETLDSADALLVAHRSAFSGGQDSMKLYDFAATGRPILVTAGSFAATQPLPPEIYIVHSVADLVDRVRVIGDRGAHDALRQHEWARSNVWSHRWRQWHRAAWPATGDA